MFEELIFNWCFLIIFGLVGCSATFLLTSALGEWLYEKFDEFTLWEWSDPETGPVITAWILACVLIGIVFAILMYHCFVD